MLCKYYQSNISISDRHILMYNFRPIVIITTSKLSSIGMSLKCRTPWHHDLTTNFSVNNVTPIHLNTYLQVGKFDMQACKTVPTLCKCSRVWNVILGWLERKLIDWFHPMFRGFTEFISLLILILRVVLRNIWTLGNIYGFWHQFLRWKCHTAIITTCWTTVGLAASLP